METIIIGVIVQVIGWTIVIGGGLIGIKSLVQILIKYYKSKKI